MEDAASQLINMDSAEVSIFFEILGCSLQTFCLEDHVKFHKKCTQQNSDDTMVIKSLDKNKEKL